MTTYDTVKHQGFSIELHYDESPMDPRDATMVGVMFAPSNRHELGDTEHKPHVIEQCTRAADYYYERADSRGKFGQHFERWLRIYLGATVVLPLRLYDHSGLSMSVGSDAHPMDPGGWDSGQVGWIFDTAETRAETGVPLDRVEEALRAEVDEYDDWLRGNVFGYVIETANGEHYDSCWGFVGDPDYALSEAKAAIGDDRSLHYTATRAERVAVFFGVTVEQFRGFEKAAGKPHGWIEGLEDSPTVDDSEGRLDKVLAYAREQGLAYQVTTTTRYTPEDTA